MTKKLEPGRGWISREGGYEVEVLGVKCWAKGKQKIHTVGFKYLTGVNKGVPITVSQSQFLGMFKKGKESETDL